MHLPPTDMAWAYSQLNSMKLTNMKPFVMIYGSMLGEL